MWGEINRIRAISAASAVLLLLACVQPAATSAQGGPTITATVGATPTGGPLPSGFLGLSLEYRAVHAYTGRDPLAINPVFLNLIRGLTPGQPPVLRIGGDSADWTWWPVRRVIPRGGLSYRLTKGWLRTTSALAADLGAKLILGINLASDRAALATAEAQALIGGIGHQRIAALEIGNEPDLYGVFPWYRDRLGHVVLARSRRYSFKSYLRDFSRWRAALPKLPLVGPSYSTLTWLSKLSRFLKAEKSVRTVTIHRYPLHNSTTDPSSPTYPTIPNLLADSASSGLAQQLAPYIATAHAHGRQFRVDEMNSVSGRGRAGVSDTFASALWAIDALFNMAADGVDGVNIHTLPDAAYQLFSFTQSSSGWQGSVYPEYYGLLLFAQAFPTGARLLPVTVASGPVKVWATSAPDGTTRILLINKDTATPVTVQVSAPNATAPATLERLSAPSADSTSGVTLGGQSFGQSTSSGTLPPPNSETVVPLAGSYSVDLPPASAALLTP